MPHDLRGRLCSDGHYARVARDEDGIVHMLRGVDNGKDQTYSSVNFRKNNSKPCSPWDIWKA